MITISNLKKQFGETVACDIEQLTINDGDILGLVGNNGAGKTTLFRLLLDLLQPDGGSVLIDNINPAQCGCLYRRGVPHRLPHPRGVFRLLR